MLGQNFPLSDYYKGRVIDAETISRSGGWWTAVLLIDDPKSEKPFIALYRWQKKDGEWKTRKNFKLRGKRKIAKTIEAIRKLDSKILESD